MVRRPVAWIVTVVLFVEAFGVALLNWFLGMVVDRQDMSLAGLDPHMMSVSSKAAGVVFGLYFALCGLAALLVAARDRSPSGVWRILLISAAVVHGLLGAFTVGLVGWGAFAYLMVVLGLILLTLMTYDGQEGPAGAPPAGTGPEGGGAAQGEPRGGTLADGETPEPPGTPAPPQAPGSDGPAPVTS
ncbi:hypothetical protein [Streptomyces colonosanans]|uniref:Uncharacterized protein n=1 Tax=Streptomyces colonosanans TaxID=1428652 RepID=A0A1S2PE12_9ACTN|nr:hypothetical protein [Streptomyces colonosanans]OIJ91174.1 hypothetical protein BIV24_16430 [Streptomyces colonosanans]